MRHRRLIVGLILAFTPAIASASSGALDPEGVYIDPQGVLRTRRVEVGRRLRDLREEARRGREREGFAYVSLPRLLADARARIEAGQELTEEMRFLSGLVELRYIFVYPDEGDLVIAGPAEPIVADFPGRAVGGITGRPLLQLDDLVVALRTCGPGRSQTAFGCTIQLGQEAINNMVRMLNDNQGVVRDDPDRRREVADRMAEAAGLQPVALFELAEDTRFAWVAIEADYLLKRHALGLDPTPVRQARSYLDLGSSLQAISHQFWFELRHEPVRATADGDAYELRGPSLAVCSRRSFHEEDPEPDRAAAEYAESMTEHIDELGGHIAAFADLSNLADLSLLAALIDVDGIATRIGWDAQWALTEYPVARVETPRTATPLVNYRVTSGAVYYAGGGVRFQLSDAVEGRETVAELRESRQRPDDGWQRIDR